MRKMILAVVLVATTAAANAQASFGVKGGLNVSNLKFKYDDGDNSETESTDSKLGFNIGAFANVPLSTNFSFAPEVVFSTEGGKEKEDGEEVKYNLNYINVPVLFQYNASGFFAHTGPQFGFLMSAKAKVDFEGEEEEFDYKDELKGINLSWAVGVGYKLPGGLGVNARYNLGLSNIQDDGDDDMTTKTNTFQVGISYTFGGGFSAKK